MSTLVKIIVISILSLFIFSCNIDFNFGVQGNGNVVTKERVIPADFDTIEVSRGLDVYLTQSEFGSLTVQADENLHDLIVTKVEGNTLKIYADENISYSEAKKVRVSFKNVVKISAASGSDVYGTNTITADGLELETASGGDMELEVKVNTLNCRSSSGSELKVNGSAEVLIAKASSGSAINAKDLTTMSSDAKASTGADIRVNVSKDLTAKASSGGDITYNGNPEKIVKSSGVSGSINQQQ